MLRKICSLLLLSSFFISTFSHAQYDDQFCGCFYATEFDAGWKRDNLDWKVKDMHSGQVPGRANSHILFKDIENYSITGKLKWLGPYYFIRAKANYGWSYKGNAYENFSLHSSTRLFFPVKVSTKDKVKRQSETYDFDLAAGYPLSFCCSKLAVIPLVGFSFHRQQLMVKGKNDYFSSSSDDSSYSSSNSFYIDSSYPIINASSDPFLSSSGPGITEELGLYTDKRNNHYRFSWYGFYLGADIAYALDPFWTLFAELEGHFLDRCHRKRKSITGVSYVDNYHRTGWAYGFNGEMGVVCSITQNWFGTLTVDYKWWNSKVKHDDLEWKSVGVNLGMGYNF